MDPLLRKCHINYFLCCFERVRSGSVRREPSGSYFRRILYDLRLMSVQNRMMESLVLFDSVVNSRWFMRTSIILFLNKVDLFKQKLGRSPLGNYFPDYSGGNDVNRAAKYLLWRFNQVNRAHLNLYPQSVSTPSILQKISLIRHSLTQATDTSNIRLVFAAVKETILQNALKDSGIL
jgi:guanine nucleotide-binding protein G(i) subunit alpha